MHKQRIIWYSLAAVLVVILVLGTLGWQYRWYRLPTYATVPDTELAVPIMSTDEYATVHHDRPYILRLSGGDGELLFIGTTHTKDPDDSQIDLIKQQWEEFKPTIALCESRLGFFIGGMDLGIEMFGEPAAVFALARRDGVPVWTLEPSYETEVAYQLEMFEPWQAAMFYSMRPYLQRIKGVDEDTEPEFVLSSLLYNRTDVDGIRNAIPDATVFDSLWRDNLAHIPDWRMLPDTFLWPGRSYSFLNQIATRSSYFRDLHMVRLIDHLVENGERVFAVVGSSHVVMQEPALRALIQ